MSEAPKNEPIVPTDLPGNSYTQKKPNPPVEKKEEDREPPKQIVSGSVVRKKRGFMSKFRETLTGDDSKTVADYILFEVLIPSMKNMLSEATKEATDRLLFGSSGPKRSRHHNNGPTPYGKMYNGNDRRGQLSPRARAQHDFQEITIPDRGEAEEILDQLNILIEDYGHAKVSDLYSMSGISTTYVDGRWGWTDLRTATVERTRNGYLLDIPAPQPLR